MAQYGGIKGFTGSDGHTGNDNYGSNGWDLYTGQNQFQQLLQPNRQRQRVCPNSKCPKCWMSRSLCTCPTLQRQQNVQMFCRSCGQYTQFCHCSIPQLQVKQSVVYDPCYRFGPNGITKPGLKVINQFGFKQPNNRMENAIQQQKQHNQKTSLEIQKLQAQLAILEQQRKNNDFQQRQNNGFQQPQQHQNNGFQEQKEQLVLQQPHPSNCFQSHQSRKVFEAVNKIMINNNMKRNNSLFLQTSSIYSGSTNKLKMIPHGIVYDNNLILLLVKDNEWSKSFDYIVLAISNNKFNHKDSLDRLLSMAHSGFQKIWKFTTLKTITFVRNQYNGFVIE